MNKILDNKELEKLIYERDRIKKLLEATNIDYEKEALELLLELKEQEISHKKSGFGINKILYNKELKDLVSEKDKLEKLLEATNIDERKDLETLLKLKEKEISDKINIIKYYSLMIAPVNHYIAKLFKHFIGGYEWRVKKCGVELDFGEETYWISFGDYLLGTPQKFFIRYISQYEYNSSASPDSLFTEFYKLNDAAKDDIDKLEPISDLPNYVEDFMSYIIMWRIENKSIVIPEENLEEIYNTIIEKYNLDKENQLKRVK